MGIPYYFYTLTKTYQNIVSSKLPAKTDVYCMDFNGVIHPLCAKMLAEEASISDTDVFEDKLIKALYQKVLDDIYLLQPKTVYICVDGVVPVAKMIQQRKRRYLTVYKNKLDNVQVKWDTTAITPGTQFMKKLNTYFKSQIRYNTLPTDIYFSGSDENGEGEHKIFRILQTLQSSNSIVINGLDADLIILSLINHRDGQNIYLMREDSNQNTTIVDITNLRQAIINEMTQKWDIINCNHKDLIESYCVMCSLLGNDFIPHLLTLNLKNPHANSLDKLIRYSGQAYKTFGLLVTDGIINNMVLSDILQNVAKTEDNDIFTETKKYLLTFNGPKDPLSEFYGLKNKDPLASQIYANPSKWRQLYYKKLFYTNTLIDSTVINIACKNYIKGIHWTYNYYKRKNIDNIWYYPYSYPPSVKDIANYTMCINDNECTEGVEDVDLDANMQMLIVLPRECKHLLESKYAQYIDDHKKGLAHLYPKSYTIHTYLKTHLWECCPELPLINVPYIRKIIRQSI